jgi:hypothetical protein
MVSKPSCRISRSFHLYQSWLFLALMSMSSTIPTAVNCLSLLSSCGHHMQPSTLSSSSSSQAASCHRRAFIRHQAAAAAAGIVVVTAILGVQQEPAFAAGSSAQQNLALDSQQLALRPATEEQPRIPLPDSIMAVSSTSGPQPVVQGLIYLQAPRTTRPPPVGSVILVTVKRVSSSSAAAAGTLLAAAQFPVSTGKLPVRFQFTKDNFEKRRVTSKMELDSILESEDLLVEATCCPAENVDRSTATCLVVNGPIGINDGKDEIAAAAAAPPFEFLSASGIAKLLRLPGKDGDNNAVTIRAAVSLPLHF